MMNNAQAIFREETAAALRVSEEAADITFTGTEERARAAMLVGAQGNPTGRAYANVAYVPGSDNGIKAIDQSFMCLNPANPCGPGPVCGGDWRGLYRSPLVRFRA